MPAAHRHDGYVESVYGVECVLTWTVGGETRHLHPGQAICIPRGAVDRFEDLGREDAKAFAAVTPGVLRPDYFRELAEVVSAGSPDPTAVAGRDAPARPCPV